jgi:hypothetical protein
VGGWQWSTGLVTGWRLVGAVECLVCWRRLLGGGPLVVAFGWWRLGGGQVMVTA